MCKDGISSREASDTGSGTLYIPRPSHDSYDMMESVDDDAEESRELGGGAGSTYTTEEQIRNSRLSDEQQ